MSLSVKQKLLLGITLALFAEGVWWKLELSRKQQRERLMRAEAASDAVLRRPAVPPPPPPPPATPLHLPTRATPDVVQAVNAFHAAFNKGTREPTSRYAGNHTAYDELTNKVDVSRENLGKVVSSKLIEYREYKYAARSDKQVIVNYETVYSSGKIFEEQFSWNIAEGKIKLDDHLLFGKPGR